MNQFIQKTDKAAFVIPTKDVRRLNSSDLEVLQYIIKKIDELRKADGKNPLSANGYIICNKDEPYSDEVWDVILEGERNKLIADDEVLRNCADKELEEIVNQFPCPHCDPKKQHRIFLEGGYSYSHQIGDQPNRFFAICSGCGHTTEWVRSPVKAAELWCTRNGVKPDLKAVLNKIKELEQPITVHE